jgi:hypothetical protein
MTRRIPGENGLFGRNSEKADPATFWKIKTVLSESGFGHPTGERFFFLEVFGAVVKTGLVLIPVWRDRYGDRPNDHADCNHPQNYQKRDHAFQSATQMPVRKPLC